jgi:predicted nucleic acid-binding protein
MSGPLYLADTNILIRLVKLDHPEYPLVRGAVNALREQGIKLGYTLQNMAEFWNASTRPRERNGFGLTVEETEYNAQQIERSFAFLADGEAVYREWRRIVMQHRVSGVQVHDARLAAAMYAHGLTHILTFNGSDFSRFSGLTAIHPNLVFQNEVRP